MSSDVKTNDKKLKAQHHIDLSQHESGEVFYSAYLKDLTGNLFFCTLIKTKLGKLALNKEKVN